MIPECSRELLERESMYFGNIKEFSIENGEGVRVSLFVSGCRNHCKNCFSEHTWAFDYGAEFTKEIEQHIIDTIRPQYMAGLTVLGGEPFEPENQVELLPFLKRVREELPEKTIWMYTGFTYEELCGERGASRGCIPETQEIFKLIDVLVDGRFVEELKNLRIRFRGSENQRIIDMPKTLEAGGVILREDLMKERDRTNDISK